MNFMRSFYALILVALVLSGASPACEFIKGKSIIEICAADGTLKAIEVAADQTPENHQENTGHKSKPDCAFCFAQTHMKSGKATSFILTAQQISVKTNIKEYVGLNISIPTTSQPRAPPQILS